MCLGLCVFPNHAEDVSFSLKVDDMVDKTETSVIRVEMGMIMVKIKHTWTNMAPWINTDRTHPPPTFLYLGF